MRGPKPPTIVLQDAERAGLDQLVRRHTTAQQLALRARIVLAAAAGANNSQIARQEGVNLDTVRLWRARWLGLQAVPLTDLTVEERLADAPRPGNRCVSLMNRSARLSRSPVKPPPRADGRSASGPAANLPTRSNAAASSTRFRPATRHACSKGALQPHRWRYWLTPSGDAGLRRQGPGYLHASTGRRRLAEQGERIVSTDELTGVQALERKHPTLPMLPGKVERREFEYIRHGTCSFILSRDVVTGQIVAPAPGPTRTEADFLAHVQAVVATDPAAQRWHFVVDNLDIHRSASLVQWVADESDRGHRVGRERQARHLAHPAEPGGVPD